MNPAADQVQPARVAVLLASYNGLPYIHGQVESILKQQGCAVDIFVSDDQSSDGTWEWLNEKKLSERRLHLLPRIERFRNAARNFYRLLRDVDFSHYDYVALADQDDIWLEDKLTLSILELLTRNCAAVSSDVVAFWPDGKRRLVHKSQPQRRLDFLFGSAGPGCTYVLTAECARRLGTFLVERRPETEKIQFHDWLIYAWVRSHGMKWHIESTVTMMYRQHASNEYGANSGWSAFLRRLAQVRSGWYREQILRISELMAQGATFTAECAATAELVRRRTLAAKLSLLTKIGQLRRDRKDRVFLFLACALGGV